MLGQRCRRCASIKTALCPCVCWEVIPDLLCHFLAGLLVTKGVRIWRRRHRQPGHLGRDNFKSCSCNKCRPYPAQICSVCMVIITSSRTRSKMADLSLFNFTRSITATVLSSVLLSTGWRK